MVDEKEILKQYSYKATSNLVLEQDRRRRRDRNADGPTALHAENLPGRMGDRATRDGPRSPNLQNLLDRKRARTTNEAADHSAVGSAAPAGADGLLADADIVAAADALELDAAGSAYVPSTAVAQRAFEGLLAFVLSKLGDQPRELLRAAANETLALLKDDALVELDRKKDIESVLGTMNADEFSRLSMLGRQISDFRPEEPVEMPEVDQPIGVGVDPDDGEGEGSDAQEEEFAEEVVELENEDEAGVLADRPHDDLLENDGLPEDPMEVSRPVAPTLDLREVDDSWLNRELAKFYTDEQECSRLTNEVFSALETSADDRTCEYRLVTLLQFDKFDFLSKLLENRLAIVYAIKLSRAEDESERARIEQKLLEENGGADILSVIRKEVGEKPDKDAKKASKKLSKRDRSRKVSFKDGQPPADDADNLMFGRRKPKFALRKVDLESLTFQRGGRLMTVRDCKLPEGSEHIENKDYEEWLIPATRAKESASKAKTIPIADLPGWAQSAFSSTKQLNRMQSTVFPCAFESDENMLLCAPTGAGKTNVAMLTVLRALRMAAAREEDLLAGLLPKKKFKVVYVAPMKALVTEVVENLGKRLSVLGLNVRELTGDVNISKYELEDTHVIVTTPEKWDIITRKSSEKTFTREVVLLIVDEIHLLHDERGPDLESVIARTLRAVDSFASKTRVVGLSATLPNYKDVASFIRVDPLKGLFYFDSSHRPCPLRQCYVGITAKKALKRFQLMNELTYTKVKAQLKAKNQVIVFVHSRKETTATCQYFIDKSIEDEVTDLLVKPGSASYELIQSEIPNVVSKDLSGLLEHGLATHHAGMTRSDRQLVEALFEAGHVKVLVSTATLAWGVNLPAHCVIIKGTQVYSPEQGRWVELSSMDVMQMMGRAGRPQFDTYGEGYIITSKTDVLYYLSLLNNQLPIESQFISRLIDMLNAEVSSGAVSSVIEGSNWLSYTYLYVRMVKNAMLYGIAAEERSADPSLERRRAELIHAAARELHRCGLVKYNEKSGEVTGTELGKVAADFYVGHESMSFYIDRMTPSTTDIELLRVFAGSSEFKHMHVREEEKLELARLAERVPIPIKESLDEPSAKVNVLLQSYISNLSLEGLAMKADMVYVTQSAARLARALLHVALQMKCAPLVERCLSLCKNVTTRQWNSQTPLRQFRESLGMDVIHKLERKDYPFERYYDLGVAELGELMKDIQLGKRVHRLVHSLPRLEMDARVRPISRSTVEVELNLLPDFRFERRIHRGGELFWITVEDSDSEVLLHSELFFVRSSLSSEDHTVSFCLQLSMPLQPQYFIRCSSDRWIVPETVLPISFRSMVLPEKFAALSKPLGDQLLPVVEAFDLKAEEDNADDIHDLAAFREALTDCSSYFGSRFSEFSDLPSQLFSTLFGSQENALVASIPGSDRNVFAELAIARLFSRQPTSVAVWVCGKGKASLPQTVQRLTDGIGKHLGLKVGEFLSDKSQDISFIRTSGTVAVTTPEVWDMFSRRWREKRVSKIMKKIGLVILDDIQALSDRSSAGVALEVVGSRLRYIAAEFQESGLSPFRIVALGDPIANGKDIGRWLGCPSSAVKAFHPKDICKDVKVEVVSSPAQMTSRQINSPQLTQQVLSSIRKHIGSRSNQTVVWVPSRILARDLALELVGAASLSGASDRFQNAADESFTSELEKISTKSLRECLKCGIGFIHENLTSSDVSVLERLYASGLLLVMVATWGMSWRLSSLDARLTIIAGSASEQWGSTATRRSLYNQTDLMRMVFGSRGSNPSLRKRSVVLITEAGLAAHYRNNLLEPVPVESQLPGRLADHINAEIVSGVVESKQDAVDYLTWTFFYHRLEKNPNYYGMKGTSHTDISNLLSDKVETVLKDLETSRCVAVEGDDDVALGTLNLGIIASHYYMRYATVELFSSSITPNTRLKGLLDILSLASEFDNVPVRVGEEDIVQALAADARVSLQDGSHVPSYSDPHVKTHVLLQSQLSRTALPPALSEDLRNILPVAVHLLKALVDIISSAGWLRPALEAVELMRMLVQAVWDSDPPLMQLPHVGATLATRLRDEFEVESIFDFLDMEDSVRADVLGGLSEAQILEMAAACDRFPSLEDMEITSVTQERDENGLGVTTVSVQLQRNDEDEDEDGDGDDGAAGAAERKGRDRKGVVPQVVAERFVEGREEGWWVVVGDVKRNAVVTVKHVALKKSATVKLQFATPGEAGRHELTVYVMSDSYMDCDQEDRFEVEADAEEDGGESGDGGGGGGAEAGAEAGAAEGAGAAGIEVG